MSGGANSPQSPASPRGERALLALLGGDRRITAEDVSHMFESLTGKVSSPEELARIQMKLDEAYARLDASQPVEPPGPAQSITREEIRPTWPFTYHEHENNYFRLSNHYVPAVRRGGKWVPYQGLYLPCDIWRYGSLVSQDEAEFSGR